MHPLANAGKESTHPEIYRVFPLLESDDMTAETYMQRLIEEMKKERVKNKQLLRAALIYTWFCCQYQKHGPLFQGEYQMRRQNAQVGSEEDKRKQIENITDDWDTTFQREDEVDPEKRERNREKAAIFKDLANHLSKVDENLNGKAMDYLVMLFCPLILEFTVSYKDSATREDEKKPKERETEQEMLAASLALDILREKIRRVSKGQQRE